MQSPPPTLDYETVISVRHGLGQRIILLSIATVVLFLGSLELMPSIHSRNPGAAFALFGIAAALGVTGCWGIVDRRPRVCFTEDELQLPGWNIERIAWRDIVRAETGAGGEGTCLCIDLRPAARGRVRQPPRDERVAEIMCAFSGRRHDLVLMYVDGLEWSAEQLVDEINRRASDAAAAAGR